MTAPGTLSLALLHGILPRYGHTLRYSYVYVYVHVHLCHDQRNHCTATARALPYLHQVYNASTIIGIRIYVLAAVSNWI